MGVFQSDLWSNDCLYFTGDNYYGTDLIVIVAACDVMCV